MRVLLVRHGVAHDRADPACPPDPERALTDEGRRKTRRSAQGLRALGLKPSRILASPYRRARETADIIADVLALAPTQRVVTDALLPDAAAYAIFHALFAFQATDAEVVCVGHAPNLDRVIALALTGQPVPVTGLKKAGAALLDVPSLPQSGGSLVWLMPPKALGAAGG